MAKATVYLETSVLSYLAARPSRDVLVLAQQQVTAEWWEVSREEYALYVSTVVVEEAASGNSEAAQRRLSLLGDAEIEAINRVCREAGYEPPVICTPIELGGNHVG